MGYRGNVHGEFSSADASALSEALARFTIFQRGGVIAVASIAATDRFVITDIRITGAATMSVWAFDGADNVVDAGEVIEQGDVVAGGAVGSGHMRTPHFCQLGTFPHVKTSGAGAVKGTFRGYLEQNAVA